MKRWLPALSIILLGVGLGLMAHDSSTAKNLAVNIVNADNSGQDVTSQLVVLNDYSSSHMGSSVSLELKGSYTRAVQAAQNAAAPTVNGQVYAQAQAACAGGKDSLVQARCVQSYLDSHQQSASTQPLVLPNESDYVHSFKSPIWTPDAAGLCLAVGVGGLVLWGWFRLLGR